MLKNIVTFLILILNTELQQLNYSQLYQYKLIPITDAKPFSFAYPAQVLLQNKQYLDLLAKRNNNLQILFYGSVEWMSPNQNQNQKRYLIASLNTNPVTYIGVEFLVRGWPSYTILIQKSFKTYQLSLILGQFNIYQLDPNFKNYYTNVQSYLLKDPQFYEYLRQYESSQNQEQAQTIDNNQGYDLTNLINGQQVQPPKINTSQIETQESIKNQQQQLAQQYSQMNELLYQQILQELIRQELLTKTQAEQQQNTQPQEQQQDQKSQITKDPNLNSFDNIFLNQQNFQIFKKEADELMNNATSIEQRDQELDKLLLKYDINPKNLQQSQIFTLQKSLDLNSNNQKLIQKNDQQQSNSFQTNDSFVPSIIKTGPEITSLEQSIKLNPKFRG